MRALTATAAIGLLLCVLWLFGFGCRILYPPSFFVRVHSTEILKETEREPSEQSRQRIHAAALRLQQAGERIAAHEQHATIAHLAMMVVLLFALYVLWRAHRDAGGR